MALNFDSHTRKMLARVGRLGGKKNTPAQQAARKNNIAKARAKMLANQASRVAAEEASRVESFSPVDQ